MYLEWLTVAQVRRSEGEGESIPRWDYLIQVAAFEQAMIPGDRAEWRPCGVEGGPVRRPAYNCANAKVIQRVLRLWDP